jgi:DEAD/DEAH box helicase domain-containing protein
LTGLDFTIVDNDTSRKNASDILLIEPKNAAGILGNVLELEKYFVLNTNKVGITFLDSRKMVEQLGEAVRSETEKKDALNSEADNLKTELDKELSKQNKSVLVYRAGYENDDREKINEQLIGGYFCSVIATSTLEMGIDIKELDLCILLGIPYSATSFYQRIGRVGRTGGRDGLVIIINDKSIRCQTFFDNSKDSMYELPVSQGGLYLENEPLQNIHALCFAETDGEYDAVGSAPTFATKIDFPESFINRCKMLRGGTLPIGYDEIKEKVELNYPQNTFPLRELEPQFQVELVRLGNATQLGGKLSRSQVQREAYPALSTAIL